VRHETIAVAGGTPLTLFILTTPHGPTLNAANPALEGFPPLALKWAAAQSDWRLLVATQGPAVESAPS
jgi:acyl-homoserine lactone acylase PvdQ